MEFTLVVSATDREVLRELLVEFHGWMAAHAGGAYDTEAELDDY